ncbi:DEAD/DEAH box helicase [Hujiaoplasma nucleasis]|uniref:DEAD/DEAH box helicase n=1 Tax=Hujiaoplasma nucleasis TaxID=2725268 RepID=A0A7L6N630_9MOLU|nr:DEAD/DEAH box helicase [Hujiaoplasma nucleasis]QLY40727.1 DEAD/DEAH box helicase [Hujiaoplasma nucleasis]
MSKNLKQDLSNLKRNNMFQNIMKKLCLSKELETTEEVFILNFAMILIEMYKKYNKKTLIEFSYFVILKYSLTSKNYLPLYDFSYEMGFYPIIDEIFKHKLVDFDSPRQVIYHSLVNDYKDDYVNTFEQKESKSNFIKSKEKEISYTAPTSYGKSEVMISLVKDGNYNNVCIIVPSKSLLVQTFNSLKSSELNYKLILHDEMYKPDESRKNLFILTQERALRLFDKWKPDFDIIFVDEAHNLLDLDSERRSVLLARFLKKYKKSRNTRIAYLSPFVAKTSSLKMNDVEISNYKIEYNMKEPELYLYNKQCETYYYNRFTNEFYYIKTDYDSYLEYIIENSNQKNFVYITQPKKIEEFAHQLIKHLPDIESNDLAELISTIEGEVDTNYNLVECLKKGVIYLHAQMPQIIKEFLESKFKELSDLKCVIGNSVVLEGINMPVQTMFILSQSYLNEKKALNLIGRVNRLNFIFNSKENNLDMLVPRIHFVDTVYYNSRTSKLSNFMLRLRSTDFDDDIKNPLLDNFENITEKERVILHEEECLDEDTKEDVIKNLEKTLIKNGVSKFYKNFEVSLKRIYNNIVKLRDNYENIYDRLYAIFIRSNENNTVYGVKRLQKPEARMFYHYYLANNYFKGLKENIRLQYTFYKTKVNDDYKLYVDKFGEISYRSDDYEESFKKCYINLKGKSDKDLKNIAIRKISVEEKFIKYTLGSFVDAMYELGLIVLEEYNYFHYGTTRLEELDLIYRGIPFYLVKAITDDKQIENIIIDNFGNLLANQIFLEYLKTKPVLFRFEVEKYIMNV